MGLPRVVNSAEEKWRRRMYCVGKARRASDRWNLAIIFTHYLMSESCWFLKL